jgi:hypothetical protein
MMNIYNLHQLMSQFYRTALTGLNKSISPLVLVQSLSFPLMCKEYAVMVLGCCCFFGFIMIISHCSTIHKMAWAKRGAAGRH